MSSHSSRALSALLLTVALALGLGGALTARSAPAPFVSANGVTLQQGSTLPVFRLTAPPVSAGGASDLSQRFSQIYERQPIGDESYLGRPRYTVPNTKTLSLLTQYAASGGFYALNLGEIGAETPRGEVDAGQAQRLACIFLLSNGFVDGQGNLLLDPQTPQGVSSPNNLSCDFNADPQKPLYPTRLIQAATVPAGTPAALPAVQTIGALVQVPLFIPTGQRQGTPLPLGGPGGHLSLLFRTTGANDTGPTLDDSVPGLAAVAAPFFGRRLEPLREVPVTDLTRLQQQVEASVRASFPNADAINFPEPSVFYDVRDAAVEQAAIEPVASYSGVEVTVDGQTIILRDIVVPLLVGGAGGFGPTVSIGAPAGGASFAPGQQVDFSGQISGGVGPYTYQWLSGGGDPLSAEASLAAPGPVTLRTDELVADGKDGAPAPVTVVLRVSDAEGAVREASVTLTPAVGPTELYLAQLFNDRLAGAQAAPAPRAGLDQAGYSFGVEANWDYPPAGAGGSDLPGVVPDASGFRSGMLGYGYSQRFAWYNSAAWEKDWRDCGLGGADCSYGVDRADYVYYAGHGSAGGISLASNVTSTWFGGENARYQTLRWVGFASCQTLRVQGFSAPNEPIRRWFGAFQGAHMLLGFNSNMRDVAFGGRLVDNMRMPGFFGIDFPWAQQTIAQAWVTTAFQLNAGRPAYLYARGTNGANPLNDKLPKPGQPMPARPLAVASYHWVWWNE